MNDQKGANILAPVLPPARELIADRGYDSNPFRAALAERGITACIPPKKNRKQPIAYEDYVALGGEAGAKDAGKMRVEGKEYVVKDGDVLLFRFNV